MVCKCGARVKASLGARRYHRFQQAESALSRSLAKIGGPRTGTGRGAPAKRRSKLREPVSGEAAERDRLAADSAGLRDDRGALETGRASHPPATIDAHRRARTTSAARRRSNAETDTGPRPFPARSANAPPSIQPASRDPGTIAVRTRFPAGTPGGRTPDARDERWPVRNRPGNTRPAIEPSLTVT